MSVDAKSYSLVYVEFVRGFAELQRSETSGFLNRTSITENLVSSFRGLQNKPFTMHIKLVAVGFLMFCCHDS